MYSTIWFDLYTNNQTLVGDQSVISVAFVCPIDHDGSAIHLVITMCTTVTHHTIMDMNH